MKENEEQEVPHLTELPQVSPLSDSQMGVYFECLEDPESTKYNIPLAVELPKDVDEAEFIVAVRKAAANHPSLFVTIHAENGEPEMRLGKIRPMVNLSVADDFEEAKRNFVQPFDLERGPLYRFELCETDEGILFLLDVHHLVFDGSSIRVLLEEIAKAYEGIALTAEQLTLFDVAAADRSIKTTEKYREAQAYFRGQLENVEFDANLISDRDANAKETGAGMVTVSTEDASVIAMAEDFARKTGITESTLFLASFAITQAVYAGTADSCFMTVNNGRHDARLQNTVGMFVRSLPVHFAVPWESKVADFLHQVQSVFHETMKHDCISFAELVKNYGVTTDVSFVYQSELLSEVKFGDTFVRPKELSGDSLQCHLLCMAIRTRQGYEIQTQYQKALYSEQMMTEFSESVLTVLRSLLQAEKLSDIAFTTPEKTALMDLWNQTEMPYENTQTVCEILNETVKRCAEKTALVYEDRTYTYAEFDAITKRIAATLESRNIRVDDFVAVLAPRNDLAVLAAWGIIRSGAGYQPLDPSYPAERLNYMVQDSHAKLVIADRSLIGLLNEYEGPVLYTDEFAELLKEQVTTSESMDRPDGAIALIYTSGTTGKPKGCVLENRNLVAFFHNHTSILELDAESRVASYASFGFDAGVMDIVTTALVGAALYIIPDEMRLDLAAVEEFYGTNQITHGFMTTQVGRMFAESTQCKTLKAF